MEGKTGSGGFNHFAFKHMNGIYWDDDPLIKVFSKDGSTSSVKGCLTKRTFSTWATHGSVVGQVDPRSFYSDEPGNGCHAGKVQLLRPSGD